MSNATIGTLGALHHEWETTTGHQPLGHWATGALAPFTTGADIQAWSRTQACKDVDPVLHALLVAHSDGHALAGRIVLQMMLGKVAKIAAAQPIDSSDNRFDDTVSVMWEQISTLPRRHTTSLATRLSQATTKALAQRRRATEVPTPSYDTDPQATSQSHSPVTNDLTLLLAEELDPGSIRMSPSELVEVTLTWAQRNQVASPAEVTMLRDLHCQDTTMVAYARAHALAPAAVRQRNRRAINRIRTALAHELAA